MKQKGKIANVLIPAAMLTIVYLIYKYQDTDAFQNTMGFLFNPDARYALPAFWQENRMLFLAIPLVVAFIWYKSTWGSYRNLIHIYRDSPAVTNHPEISALQASYLFQQEQVSCLTTWLLEMCNKGAVSIRYDKGYTPWSLQKGFNENIDPQDKELLAILFRNNNTYVLRPPLSNPIQEVKEAAEALFDRTKEEYRSSFLAKQNRLPAWLLLFVLAAEIPFYVASQEANLVGTLPVTLFSTLICIAPAYVFCRYLPTFVQGPKLIAIILMIFSVLFVLFAHSLMYSNPNKGAYLLTALYPNISAVLLTLLYMVPLVPKESTLLTQIVGYQKYLSSDGYPTQEEDLPWTLGLNIHADIIESSFRYGSTILPAWLETENDKNAQDVVKLLHQTFATHVNKAVYGEANDKTHRTRSLGRNREL